MDAARFRRDLLDWFEQAQRRLPWRETRDPYRILVSEVMLQQTRVAAAIPYYERFLQRFPTVEALAEAPEQDLLAAWSGLGYYYRARNLQVAARQIVEAGGFRAEHEFLRGLRGVGEYTAAAVASIAFDLPYGVVDGNVLRVVARLWNDPADIASQTTRRVFQSRVDTLLDDERPGAFNQALMELGATLCTPKKPQCLLCPVAGQCAARSAGTQEQLPVKKAARETVEQNLRVAVIVDQGRLVLKERGAEERLMPGFFELPQVEEVGGIEVGEELGTVRHAITHHRITCRAYACEAKPLSAPFRYAVGTEWRSLPLTTITRKVLQLPNVIAIVSK